MLETDVFFHYSSSVMSFVAIMILIAAIIWYIRKEKAGRTREKLDINVVISSNPYADPPIPEKLYQFVEKNPDIALAYGELCVFSADCRIITSEKPIDTDFRTTIYTSIIPLLEPYTKSHGIKGRSAKVFITNRRYEVNTGDGFSYRYKELESIEGFGDGFVFYAYDGMRIITMISDDAAAMSSVISMMAEHIS